MADAGILRIEKHDDKLCFRNPGLLRLPIEQIYEGGNSKARNPRIQNMLRMIGFGENLGSGFPKIIAAWKETNWGEPELKNKIELDEVELVLPVKVSATANDTVNDTANDTVNLTAVQQKMLEMIKQNRHTTYDEMAMALNISRKTIARHIASLKEKGVLQRKGEDKNGFWIIVTK